MARRQTEVELGITFAAFAFTHRPTSTMRADRRVVYSAITRRAVLFTLDDVSELAAARPIVLGVLEVRGGVATPPSRLLTTARVEAARHGGTHAVVFVIGREGFIVAPWSEPQRERPTVALLVVRIEVAQWPTLDVRPRRRPRAG